MHMFALVNAPGMGEAAATTPSTGGTLLQLLIPLALMVVLFYFMLIRPQKKRDKEVKNMLSNLKVGDRVKTIGMLYGRIISIKDDTVTLEVGTNKTQLVIDRRGIASVEGSDVENEMQQ